MLLNIYLPTYHNTNFARKYHVHLNGQQREKDLCLLKNYNLECFPFYLKLAKIGKTFINLAY